jgi:hypothetical protein
MSVMVIIHFPVDFEEAERRTGGKVDWAPVIAAWKAAGARHYHQLKRDGEFLDLDEFPSIEAYEQFKAEAGPTIEGFETLLGVRSTDVVWEVADRREA